MVEVSLRMAPDGVSLKYGAQFVKGKSFHLATRNRPGN
jgi:hypothetical protein